MYSSSDKILLPRLRSCSVRLPRMNTRQLKVICKRNSCFITDEIIDDCVARSKKQNASLRTNSSSKQIFLISKDHSEKSDFEGKIKNILNTLPRAKYAEGAASSSSNKRRFIVLQKSTSNPLTIDMLNSIIKKKSNCPSDFKVRLLNIPEDEPAVNNICSSEQVVASKRQKLNEHLRKHESKSDPEVTAVSEAVPIGQAILADNEQNVYAQTNSQTSDQPVLSTQSSLVKKIVTSNTGTGITQNTLCSSNEPVLLSTEKYPLLGTKENTNLETTNQPVSNEQEGPTTASDVKESECTNPCSNKTLDDNTSNLEKSLSSDTKQEAINTKSDQGISFLDVFSTFSGASESKHMNLLKNSEQPKKYKKTFNLSAMLNKSSLSSGKLHINVQSKTTTNKDDESTSEKLSAKSQNAIDMHCQKSITGLSNSASDSEEVEKNLIGSEHSKNIDDSVTQINIESSVQSVLKELSNVIETNCDSVIESNNKNLKSNLEKKLDSESPREEQILTEKHDLSLVKETNKEGVVLCDSSLNLNVNLKGELMMSNNCTNFASELHSSGSAKEAACNEKRQQCSSLEDLSKLFQEGQNEEVMNILKDLGVLPKNKKCGFNIVYKPSKNLKSASEIVNKESNSAAKKSLIVVRKSSSNKKKLHKLKIIRTSSSNEKSEQSTIDFANSPHRQSSANSQIKQLTKLANKSINDECALACVGEKLNTEITDSATIMQEPVEKSFEACTLDGNDNDVIEVNDESFSSENIKHDKVCKQIFDVYSKRKRLLYVNHKMYGNATRSFVSTETQTDDDIYLMENNDNYLETDTHLSKRDSYLQPVNADLPNNNTLSDSDNFSDSSTNLSPEQPPRNMNDGPICFKKLLNICYDNADLIQFLLSLELIRKPPDCPYCLKPAKLTPSNLMDMNNGYAWFCHGRSHPKVPVNANKSVPYLFFTPVLAGSWFNNSSIPLDKLVLACYMWLRNRSFRSIIHEAEIRISDLYQLSYLINDVCTRHHIITSEEIGGEGEIVEIHEGIYTIEKYKTANMREPLLFGGVNLKSGKHFMAEVDKKNPETFFNLIKKWIKPGSTIVSSCWTGYKDLDNEMLTQLKKKYSLEISSVTAEKTIDNKDYTLRINRVYCGHRKRHYIGGLSHYMFLQKFKGLNDDVFLAYCNALKMIHSLTASTDFQEGSELQTETCTEIDEELQFYEMENMELEEEEEILPCSKKRGRKKIRNSEMENIEAEEVRLPSSTKKSRKKNRNSEIENVEVEVELSSSHKKSRKQVASKVSSADSQKCSQRVTRTKTGSLPAKRKSLDYEFSGDDDESNESDNSVAVKTKAQKKCFPQEEWEEEPPTEISHEHTTKVKQKTSLTLFRDAEEMAQALLSIQNTSEGVFDRTDITDCVPEEFSDIQTGTECMNTSQNSLVGIQNAEYPLDIEFEIVV